MSQIRKKIHSEPAMLKVASGMDFSKTKEGNIMENKKKPCGPGIEGAPHPNGGGFVAATATVTPTAYVGPNAAVCGNATVSGNAKVDGNALISGDAHISGTAKVYDNAQVTGNAHVSGAEVYGKAQVYEKARIFSGAKVYGEAKVIRRRKGFWAASPGLWRGAGLQKCKSYGHWKGFRRCKSHRYIVKRPCHFRGV